MASTADGEAWRDVELHAAMQATFAKSAHVPQWAVWLMQVRLDDSDPDLLTIMFEQPEKQRGASGGSVGGSGRQ